MTIALADTILYYEVSGTGDPLILLHGNGEDHTIFDEMRAALSQKFTVYAIDSRGHGKSSDVKEFHYTDMAEDIAQFILTLQLNRPVVYGYSDGGIIALLLAIRHPCLVSKLIVSGVNANPFGLKRLAYLSFLRSYVKQRDPLLKLMLCEPKISREMLKSIQVPVLMTVGSRDIIRPRHTRWICKSLPHVQQIIFPGESHFSYVVHSAFLAPIITDYIQHSTRKTAQ